jgi:hypothetical protein
MKVYVDLQHDDDFLINEKRMKHEHVHLDQLLFDLYNENDRGLGNVNERIKKMQMAILFHELLSTAVHYQLVR